MFTIEMLAAQHGDCLWIEYGPAESPHRILIDCGLWETYGELSARLRDRLDLRFELLVLTHIDLDHIAGAIPFLQEIKPGHIGDVWFNGWKHLPSEADVLGAIHGEMFAGVLTQQAFAWNQAWHGGSVVVPADGPLPRIDLPGGLKLTLLSPTRKRLEELRIAWERTLKGFAPGDTEAALEALEERPRFQPDALGPARLDIETLARARFEPDDSPSNGSSIALLAEYEGKSLLLGADAFSPVLEESIRRLLHETGRTRLRLDACKVPHHGASRNNGPDLFKLLDCRNFLFSADGSHGYNHPHPETIARILTTQKGVRLHFNYRSKANEIWDDSDLQREWDYEAFYPSEGRAGYRLAVR